MTTVLEEPALVPAEDSLRDIAPPFDNERTPEPRVFNPWIVALVVTIGTFMEVLDTSIANVALPHISGSLSASQDEGAWVLTSYLVANAIVLPISGWLSSLMGRKNFYLISVFFFTVFSALCGLAPTLGMLILFRVAQGLAGGGLQPSVQAILADTFSPQKRGMAMALYTVAILVAPVLGPTLGGWITDNYSWRWIFYINIPVGMICVFLTRMVLEDPPHMKEAKAKARTQKVDWPGLGFIAIGLATLEIILDKGQELDWFGSPFIVTFAIICVISLTGCILWELHVKAPVVNLRLLKERNFLFCCLIILGLYAVLYATTYLLPLYMQQMMGYDATTSGLALSPSGLFTMLEVPIVGYVLTKGYDPRKMVFSGMILIASSCWWMSSMNLDVAEMNLIVPRIVQVLGLGLITVPVSTMVFRFIPKTESSQGAGLYALVRNEGGSLGIALVSTMLQRRAQLFQQTIGRNLTSSSGAVQQFVAAQVAAPGAAADNRYHALALLYTQMQRQALLLAYMDQFRMLCGIMLCMLPLVFFLKRPPVQKHIELEAH
ncbi:DHA2 family efflux MFS transporter permease subunit [Granulicella sibirica]|uniref:Inner membrane component of tripartite multidrug resistance system n=1 Tax=Granulicella sibirica TaxID=2479048 RepID=A0A4Q0T4D3_9BACT|nr:DHA2 family efflux MFS transporter permease subunit [Granulicella sibirica]RXH56416.1 Inner membrane component of tripartite multidrug resistance system [Granulicella sibirica]